MIYQIACDLSEASLATHPLDVVRTKLAVQRTLVNGEPPRYKGTGGTLRRVFREEGFRGLFRGIAPAIVSHAPADGVFFSTYSFIKCRIPDSYQPSSLPRGTMASSVAAGGAWSTTCVIMNPLFVLKTKQHTQLVRANRNAPLKYTGLISSFRVVLAEQGVRGLYAGVLAAMAGAPGGMIQMPLYEFLKGGGTFRSDGSLFNSDEHHQQPSHIRIALSSSCSASCVGIVMYPWKLSGYAYRPKDILPAVRNTEALPTASKRFSWLRVLARSTEEWAQGLFERYHKVPLV